jgi:hypothetical protein
MRGAYVAEVDRTKILVVQRSIEVGADGNQTFDDVFDAPADTPAEAANMSAG